MTVLVPTTVQFSKGMSEFVRKVFDRGGHHKMQINDVIEAAYGVDPAIEAEAVKLMEKFGEFYIRKADA